MEFDEMKLIWDSQNNEPLYAINQEALNRKIQHKSRSVTRALDFVDVMMIVVNLIGGIVLIVDTVQENGRPFEYIVAVVYLAFFVYALYRRFARQQEVKEFDKTILGELNKAIWESDYLIKQSSSMVFWYLVPIMIAANVTVFLNANSFWVSVLTIIILPLAYFGGRWEVRKCHLPKKRELESLREILLQAEEQTVA
jgi:Ca2+/Na+ antiporter